MIILIQFLNIVNFGGMINEWGGNMPRKEWKEGMRFIPEVRGAELINKAAKIFKRHNITFWLDYGTMLGKTRDGRFIPHDRDVDFGVDYRTWDHSVIEELLDNGFTLRKTPFRVNDKRVLKYIGKSKLNSVISVKLGYRWSTGENKTKGIKICVEVYHLGVGKYKENLYFWAHAGHDYVFKIPKKYIFPLIKSTFYETEIYTPGNPEEYLTYMYGENWKIHNPKYTNSDQHKSNTERFREVFK